MGSLACCSQWGRKESDTTERLNNNENFWRSGSQVRGAHSGELRSMVSDSWPAINDLWLPVRGWWLQRARTRRTGALGLGGPSLGSL